MRRAMNLKKIKKFNLKKLFFNQIYAIFYPNKFTKIIIFGTIFFKTKGKTHGGLIFISRL